MRTVIAIAVLALVAAPLTGCRHSLVAPESESWVFGDWIWTESSGGIAGMTSTPESAGYTQRLVLRESGDLLLYRDGELRDRTRFRVITGENGSILHTDDPVFTVRDLKIYEPLWLNVPGPPASYDTLVLAEDCADCFVHTFARSTDAP